MNRLASSTLSALPADVAVPAYPRANRVTGIVHFGVGAFHRAHQAMYLDRILQDDPTAPWAICGVGLLPFDRGVQNVLAAQDHLYTLVVKDSDGSAEARVIGSIVEYLFAPDDPEAVLEKLASPEVRIVSLTITEAGYPVDNETGDFDAASPLIAADLTGDGPPQSVFAYLTEGLRRRRDRGLPPFTVMSCDNIQGNGGVARTALTSFARSKDAALGDWIATSVSFPNSMVDRITPATTDEGRAEVADRYGVEDRWPVIAESFEQWVLEDDFPAGRPPLETVGVQLVADVEPYELMKLRLLNASHQVMSYLGILAGHEYVDEVCRIPVFVDFLRGYMAAEATPTLLPVPGVDLPDYQEQLLRRFSNAAIADTLARQVVDGSERIPKFLLPVLRSQLAEGGPIDHVTLVVAAWSRYLEGRTEAGRPIEITDRRAQLLRDAVTAEAERPGALLDLVEVFGDLGRSPRFRGRYLELRSALSEHGATEMMSRLDGAEASRRPTGPV
ncbi:MAG: mannitol 2-dehydrogenase [Microbacteriaceae bacterium]|nr:mannitol 2-dehydrogenase [Microbacteriaceae bacterium]